MYSRLFIFLLQESESVQSVAVLLENVPDNISRDLLSMLVKNILGLDESCYSVEIIRESNRAVVTFNNPAGRKQLIKLLPYQK